MGGWRIDREDFRSLDSDYEHEHEVMAIAEAGYDANTFDARQILKSEHQHSQGSCQGHAISTALEMASCIAIGEKSLELSRAMGYYETQKLDWPNTKKQSDRGSTISGGVRLAETVGICREDLWPYPSKYNNTRPQDWNAVLKSAERFKAGKSVRIRSWDSVVAFLEAGLGAITIGVRWNSSVNREHVTSYRRGSGGGHAVCLPQMSKKRPGEVDMLNSWGSRWADNGWATWSRSALESMLQDRFTVAIGVSDMVNLEPRQVSFAEFVENITV